jgi:hypothetical protein
MVVVAPDAPGDSGQSLASNWLGASTRAQVVQVGEVLAGARPKIEDYSQKSVSTLFADSRVVLTCGSRMLWTRQATEDGHFVSWLSDSIAATFDPAFALGWHIWNPDQKPPIDPSEEALRSVGGDSIAVIRSHASSTFFEVRRDDVTRPAWEWLQDERLKIGDDLAGSIQEAARELSLRVVAIQVTGLDDNHPRRGHCVLIAKSSRFGNRVYCLFVCIEAEPTDGQRLSTNTIFDHFLLLAPTLIRGAISFYPQWLPTEPPPISRALDPCSLVEQWQAPYGEKVTLPSCNTLDSLGIVYKHISIGENLGFPSFPADDASKSYGLPFVVSVGQIHRFRDLLCERIFCGQADGTSGVLHDLFLTPENLEKLGRLLCIPKASWYEVACRVWKVDAGEGSSSSFYELLDLMDQGTPFVEICPDSGSGD